MDVENLVNFFAGIKRGKQVAEKSAATMCSWPLVIRLSFLMAILLFYPLHIREQVSPSRSILII